MKSIFKNVIKKASEIIKNHIVMIKAFLSFTSLGAIITLIFSSEILLHFLYTRPIIGISQDINSIKIKNTGDGRVELLSIYFIKDGKPYCLTQSNVESFAGRDYIKYKVENPILKGQNKISASDEIKIASCDSCKEGAYNNILDEIKINIEYSGTGIFNMKDKYCDGKKAKCEENDFGNNEEDCKES